MQVLPSFQRQGLGIQLLQACTEQIVDRVCYCIPWQYLRSFYQKVGSQEVRSVEVPALLRDRFDDYISRNINVILMGRFPTLNSNSD